MHSAAKAEALRIARAEGGVISAARQSSANASRPGEASARYSRNASYNMLPQKSRTLTSHASSRSRTPRL